MVYNPARSRTMARFCLVWGQIMSESGMLVAANLLSHKLRVFKITPQLVISMLAGVQHPGWSVVNNPLPDDVSVVSWRKAMDGDWIEFIIHSDSFDTVDTDRIDCLPIHPALSVVECVDYSNGIN